MHICSDCKKEIETGLCIYESSYFHNQCCKICRILLAKETSQTQQEKKPKEETTNSPTSADTFLAAKITSLSPTLVTLEAANAQTPSTSKRAISFSSATTFFSSSSSSADQPTLSDQPVKTAVAAEANESTDEENDKSNATESLAAARTSTSTKLRIPTPSPIATSKLPKKKLSLPEKGKSGPGKLNYGQIGSFVKVGDVSCYTCKKIINDQKFLTRKVGEFNCLECHKKSAEKCSVCNRIFGAEERFFKNKSDHKFCEKCYLNSEERRRSLDLNNLAD